jgi:hypothetical protein
MASASHPRWRQSRQIDDLAEAMPDRVTLARNARDRRAMRGARRAAASRSENVPGPPPVRLLELVAATTCHLRPRTRSAALPAKREAGRRAR